jgi:hypothetical protein
VKFGFRVAARSSQWTGSDPSSSAADAESCEPKAVTCGVMDALAATRLSSGFVEETPAGGIRA